MIRVASEGDVPNEADQRYIVLCGQEQAKTACLYHSHRMHATQTRLEHTMKVLGLLQLTELRLDVSSLCQPQLAFAAVDCTCAACSEPRGRESWEAGRGGIS